MLYTGACAAPKIVDSVNGAADGAIFNLEAELDPRNPDNVLYSLIAARYGPKYRYEPLSAGTVSFRAVINLYAVLRVDRRRPHDPAGDPRRGSGTGRNHPSFFGHPYTCDGHQLEGYPAMCSPQQSLGRLERRCGRRAHRTGSTSARSPADRAEDGAGHHAVPPAVAHRTRHRCRRRGPRDRPRAHVPRVERAQLRARRDGHVRRVRVLHHAQLRRAHARARRRPRAPDPRAARRSVHVIDRPTVATALTVAVLVAAVLGAAVYGLVFRPLRHAPPLARVVASLGVFLYLASVMALRVEPGRRGRGVAPARLAAADRRRPRGERGDPGVRLRAARARGRAHRVLVAVFRLTRFGLATRAGAEHETGLTLMGISPSRLGFAELDHRHGDRRPRHHPLRGRVGPARPGRDEPARGPRARGRAARRPVELRHHAGERARDQHGRGRARARSRPAPTGSATGCHAADSPPRSP